MASIIDWFTDFYSTSDNAAAHDEYTRFFTADAKLIMGDQQARGTSEILGVRKGMWEKVASRKHNFHIFESLLKPGVVLLVGTVVYRLKSGGESAVDWAAKAQVVGEGKERAMSFYQVYLKCQVVENFKELCSLQDTSHT